jgi:predicted amidophosphoribosyltransferase
MDAILRKCLDCGEPFTAIDRRSMLCPECRQNASRREIFAVERPQPHERRSLLDGELRLRIIGCSPTPSAPPVVSVSLTRYLV